MKRCILILSVILFSAWALAQQDSVPLKKQSTKGSPQKQSSALDEMLKFEATLDKPYIASLDVYGSSTLTPLKLRKALGAELDNWLDKGLKGDPTADMLQLKLSAKVKKKFDLALAQWSILHYFEPGNLALHITLDVVEKKDAKRRMPFTASPTGEFSDPNNLIETWMEYEGKAIELVERGEIDPTMVECTYALHCPFGHAHFRLAKYRKIFVDGVKKNEKKLVEIVNGDKRALYRAAACYLLAYLPNGKQVVSLMLGRIHDPDPVVRNNAIRVLGDIAEFHPKYKIPTKPLIEALDFPLVSDRSKAGYALLSLVLNSAQAKKEVRKAGVPSLLKMLESKQPNHYEVAHSILKALSGKSYAKTNQKAWKKWYQKSRVPAQRKKRPAVAPSKNPTPKK